MRISRLIFIAALFAWIAAAPAWAQTATVSAVDSEFEPEELEVAEGTEVTWTNNGDFDHTVTADDGTFDSGTLEPGDSFTYTFTEGDEFPYYCELHGAEGGVGMAGTIILEREPTDPGGGNGNDGNGDDVGGDTTDDELPTTGPTDVWAFAYVGGALLAAGAACLRIGRSNSF